MIHSIRATNQAQARGEQDSVLEGAPEIQARERVETRRAREGAARGVGCVRVRETKIPKPAEPGKFQHLYSQYQNAYRCLVFSPH